MISGRFLPVTLFGRLALVVVAAFITLHIITSFTMTDFAQQQASRAVLADQAGSLALCLRLLDTDDTDRRVLAARLERVDNVRIRLGETPTPSVGDTDPLSVFLRQQLADRLSGLSGKDVPPGDLLVHVVMLAPDRDGDGQASLTEKRAAVLDGKRNYRIRAAFRLSDGVWVSITHRGRLSGGMTYTLSLLVLSFEALLMVLVVLAVVHRVVRPLRALAMAAEKFGRDMDASRPLPEEGPSEVREAAQAFNRMRRRIHEAMGERTRILAAVSHDLRTPVTRMRLRMENVQPPELREKLLSDLDALQNIMNTSAELARCESNPERTVPTDMTAFLESIVEDRQDMGQSVTLRGQTDGSFPVKPGALRRCVENLLDNALRYGGDAAELEVTETADSLTIAVLDAGPGIPEAFLHRVFEPFFRLEPSRNRNTGGSGLGLSIARAMARLNNGELTLENRPQGGLCARIRLSRAPQSSSC